MEKAVSTNVKSSFLSKINITQFVSMLSALLVLLGYAPIPESLVEQVEELKVLVIAAIAIINNIVTYVLRTWFTTEITAASAARLRP